MYVVDIQKTNDAHKFELTFASSESHDDIMKLTLDAESMRTIAAFTEKSVPSKPTWPDTKAVQEATDIIDHRPVKKPGDGPIVSCG